MPQQGRQGGAIGFPIEAGTVHQCLQFGREHEVASHEAHVQGLFAHAVTHERQGTFVLVPQSHGEHAHRRLQRTGNSPGTKAGEQGFRVGMAAPGGRAALAFQRIAQLQVVIDLAVQDKHEPSASGDHGLAAGFGQVQNGQPHVPQCQAGALVLPIALAIGAAMPHAPATVADDRLLVGQTAPNANDSTHSSSMPAPWAALIRFK